MAETHKPPEQFTLRMRRYDPESGEAPYWDEHTIELEPHRSVLEGILQAKAKFDGSIGIRCSCRAAICGSCGVRINGEPGLACHTHLDHARGIEQGRRDRGRADGQHARDQGHDRGHGRGALEEGAARHPVADQQATGSPSASTSWPRESMVDITQSMACIQCGACVSDCLAMEVDPGFIGPAALAKAYRFVGDPRDEEQRERLIDLSQDPQGIYDCTHCFKCVEACPKDVNPMGQIMRLRRIAGSDQHIVDQNNGHRHEETVHDADQGLRAVARGGDASALLRRQLVVWQVPPRRRQGAASARCRSSIRGVMKRKMSIKIALFGHKIPKQDLKAVKQIYEKVESKPERYELNLYVSGEDEERADTGAVGPRGLGTRGKRMTADGPST